MKTVIAASLIAASGFVAGTAYEPGQEYVRSRIAMADTPPSPLHAEERVIELPEDAKKWHTVLLVHDDWQRRPREAELVQWFRGGDRRLTTLADQTHLHIYTPSHPHYRSTTYATQFPASRLPAVVLIRSDAWVAFVRSGRAIASTSTSLGNDIADCWPRPRPQPQPSPVTPIQPVIPDTPSIPDTPAVEPQQPASDDDATGVMALLGALLGAGGAGVAGFRRRINL